ncbi:MULTISPECIES: cell wall anchor protein [Bacillus cereus group]|uniref:cell wall anchor protein n=1 Tax=Bacillus cereus group TaxID=86661 RepID=UPI0008FEA17B|nr:MULTISPECIES: cell wall anchor protein [Bacillus cereus group]MDG1622615.1 cell wall anchor protein [Bacillus mobilis]MDX5837056.1 cell wall anchor protein [Bacillus cereus group sp. BfR-BA-01700]OJE38896.1 cell wall anchor protein [Bacillus mobilis]HDR7244027.1 cell wall anchor protein [Bacillus mobilis]
MRNKGLFLIYVTFTCLTTFLYCETVLAGGMNSKAGISFSNSYIPNIDPESIIPDGSILIDNTSDDHMNKKELPRTGSYSIFGIQCKGFVSILIGLAILVTLGRNNNREDRNQKFLLNKQINLKSGGKL